MIATALALALVSYPIGVNDPDQFSRPGFPVWSGCLDVPIAATTYTLAATSNDATEAAVFRWGSTLVATSTSATPMTCCLTQTDDTTIGDQTSATAAKDVTDSNGPDGRGACFTLPPDGRRDVIVLRQAMAGRPGSRVGVCDAPTLNSIALGTVYPPCRVDADCTDANAPAGTTCDTTPSVTLKNRTGVMLQCRSSETVDARVCVDLER